VSSLTEHRETSRPPAAPAGDPREISDRPELFEKIVSSAEWHAWRAAAEELAARVRGGMT
jgi:hypothetical protein